MRGEQSKDSEQGTAAQDLGGDTPAPEVPCPPPFAVVATFSL